MTQETLTDSALIEQFLAGDHLSYEQLLSRYETKVFNLALRLTRNIEDAEEVLQDVFVTVFRKLEGFEGKAKFSSWLYRIAVNASFMKLRKRKQNKAVSINDFMAELENQEIPDRQSYGAQSDARAITNEIQDELKGAIERLPEEYRTVFVLRDVQGLSNKEVGELLSLSVPAVKSRLHRSRLMLRRRLRRFYEDYRHETKILAVGPTVMQQAA
ncbi:MAG: sigma-70 family RNA polymerase sigma factor [Bdellovibrionales bacterium]|nr:sigma-70 family RNA polymerase sigma factor [Bdellovibrionales bacterium]